MTMHRNRVAVMRRRKHQSIVEKAWVAGGMSDEPPFALPRCGILSVAFTAWQNRTVANVDHQEE